MARDFMGPGKRIEGLATMGVCLLLVALTAGVAGAVEAKRVLMVHSFGSTAPPFTTHSTAFESTLTEEMGRRVDIDEVSLDMARYAQPDMEEAFVEFLLKRLGKWRPDLVVPIGSPAGRFVARNRDRLFPGTPVIYTGMDKRTLPPEAIRTNATFVGEDFDLTGLVEDILQLQPDTNHVVVVLGATPLERYWTEQLRQAFGRFTDRVTFTWVNDLSFDDLLVRVAKLPPRSFILLVLLLRDALGVTHNEDDALQRLHAVANAPINGLYQNQLGLGIVGGRLYQAELQGKEAARIAIRILGGEPVASFPPLVIGTQPRPRYDWRELQRWGISESRLPPGSVVAFRQPTVWQRYRWWIVGGLGVALLEGALIAQLVRSLTRRRRAERALRESEERFRRVFEASPDGLAIADDHGTIVLVNAQVEQIFGYRAEELTGQPVDMLIPPRLRQQYTAHREQFAGDPRVRRYGAGPNLFGLRKDGGEVPVEIGLNPIAAVAGFFVVVSIVDVTERRRNEAEAQALRHELAHMSRVAIMGELTAAIIHELAQPLGTVLANAQAGQRMLGFDPPDLDEIREIFADIVDADHRADHVIQHLRSLFRRGEPERRPLRLNSLISDVMSMVGNDAALRNVTVVLDLAPDLPEVLGDRVQLQQVLLNLTVNAFDAMAENGRTRTLTVRTRALEDTSVQVDVADTGPGIAPDLLDSIWKPFVTTKAGGIGIGLSVSHSIVRAHEGLLWADNDAEGGAVFHVRLPAGSSG